MDNAMIKTENSPRLETERLILRRFTQGDLDDMVLLYGDEEVNTFLPWFPMRTRKEVSDYLHQVILPCYEKERGYTYAIVPKEDRKVIGYVHVHDIGNANDLGYALRKEYWHKGLTVEACKSVVDRARKDGLKYLTATHDINNPRSGNVMKAIGMKHCYTYRELWQPKNIEVLFRLYQINLDVKEERVYQRQEKRDDRENTDGGSL